MSLSLRPSTTAPHWTLAARAAHLRPSATRELLAYGDSTCVLPLAGGLPASAGFPVELVRAACDRLLTREPARALQYGGSEGCLPLRERIAERLGARGYAVDPGSIIVTNGAQQALDLLGKLLVDADATIAVETPTYVGALQAFALYGAPLAVLAEHSEAALARAMTQRPAPRFAYVMPSFRNPDGQLWSEHERAAFASAAALHRLPLIEDDPYGELWYDEPPPAPLASHWPEGVVYVGSLSKILAPGLRLGYLVLPAQLGRAATLAKQASDLHTTSFGQLLAAEVLADARFAEHLVGQRARYRTQRDALVAALRAHLPQGCRFATPTGGMFLWLELPSGCCPIETARRALAAGVAVVAGDHFHPVAADDRPAAVSSAPHLRLCFTTLPPADLARAATILGRVIAEQLESQQ